MWVRFLIILLLGPGQAAAEIPVDLVESGRGEIRYLGFIREYEAALYTAPGTGPDDILAPKHSRCLKITYDVELSADDFRLAARKILERQHDQATLQRLRPQLQQLHQAYRDVGEMDSYTLCYDAARLRTSLLLNDEELAEIISAEFAAVYFGIWLGAKDPIDQALRANLMAGLQKGAK